MGDYSTAIKITENVPDHPTVQVGRLLSRFRRGDKGLKHGDSYSLESKTFTFFSLSFSLSPLRFTFTDTGNGITAVPNRPVYHYKLGFAYGKRYEGFATSFGFSCTVLREEYKSNAGEPVTSRFSSCNKKADGSTYENIGAFVDIGFERPLYLRSNVQWGAYAGLNIIPVSQYTKVPHRGIDVMENSLVSVFPISLRAIVDIEKYYTLQFGMVYTPAYSTGFTNENSYFDELSLPEQKKLMIGIRIP